MTEVKPTCARAHGDWPERQYLDLELGRRLREARLQAGLALCEAASLAGISCGFLSMLERGQRCPRTSTMRSLLNVIPTVSDELAEKLVRAAVTQPKYPSQR